MAVFRIEKSKDYTVMSNHHLRNTDLSLRAKGLLSQILSLPEEWDYTIAGLAAINKEGKDAVRAAVQELEKAGYIVRRQKMDSGGKFSSNEYVVYEEPHFASPLSDFPSTVLPTTDKPATEEPLTGNPTELNKDVSSKDIYPLNPPEGNGANGKKKSRRQGYKAQADTLPERFEKFWKFYRTSIPPGRHAGNRQDAIKAWDKLSPTNELATEMAQSLAAQVKSAAWSRGIGVPYASTWLNNHGWEDDWGSADTTTGRSSEQNNGEAVEWAC